MQAISVVIVEDHALTREGLELLLAQHPNIQVTGTAVGIASLRKLLDKERPSVVLMDIRLGQENGLKLTQWVLERYPAIHVVILSNFDEEALVIEAISIGASGYLLKDCSSSLLAHTIHAVTDGAVLFKTELLVRAFNSVRHDKTDEPSAETIKRLTGGELAVLARLSSGEGNRSIAIDLSLSESTIKKYMQSIFAKLDVKNRTEAAALATRAGVVVK